MSIKSRVSKLSLITATVASAVVAQQPVSLTGMALIPGATFEMGIDTADVSKLMERYGVKRPELFAEESPKHRVTVRSFYIDRTEVTNAAFKRFIDTDPSWRKERTDPKYHNGNYLQNWNANDYPAGRGTDPVTFVSWYAATAFCRSQGKRLPTEAEWEFAARGGLNGKEFPWGDEMPDKTRANYSGSGINAPTAVGSYLANGYGLHDMAGNVWEYLADEWQKYPAVAAQDDSPSDFLKVTTRRALRGGSFGGAPVNLRVTYRDSHAPGNAAGHVGFRCAMTAPVQSEAINELLRIHYDDRAAHFNRDARPIFARFADEYFSVGNGQVRTPNREAGEKRLQAYFDASTFIEWDDIDPPVIRVSDDGSMAYSHVHKKVKLKSKSADGRETEETEIFAWTMTYRKIGGKWKVTSVTSTNTPEVEK